MANGYRNALVQQIKDAGQELINRAESMVHPVQTVLNEKGKIEFHISIAADQEVFEELNERYKIMIS